MASNRCDCGNRKKADYETCYDCYRDELDDNGELCDCGEKKKVEYEQCYDCFQDSK